MQRILIFTLLAFVYFFTIPIPSHAQTIPIQTQKKVISNFKTDTVRYFPFPQSNCSEKYRGDANCDNLIDGFDLSIWQVEIQNPEGTKRADFNGDGVISLVDYGIWKESYYPQKVSISNPKCEAAQLTFGSIVKLLHCSYDRASLLIVKSDFGFFQQFSNLAMQQFSRDTVYAQQTDPDTSTIRQSLPVTFADQSSMIINTNTSGSSSQISFDQNSNPISAILFNDIGAFQAQSGFQPNGDEVVSSIQDGILIQTIKKADGPVIQSFKDGNNNILAVKSWPNLASLEAGEPPLAVTVPTIDNNLMTLNISPNGTGIIIQTNARGDIITQSQYKIDGTYLSEDARYNIKIESNDKIGLSTIQIPNNLGGKTTYNFYKSGLFAIVQTDIKNNSYIAKPINGSVDNWTLSSTINGQTSGTTTPDPIAQVNGGTPSAQQILSNINYYKSLPNANIINFQDGFGTSSQIPPAILTQGNDILKVQSAGLTASPPTQTTSGLFLIKEAFAQSSGGSAATAASAAALAPTSATGNQVSSGIGNNNANITINANGTQNTTITGASGNQLASSSTSQSGDTTMSSPTGFARTIASVIYSNTVADYGSTPVGRPEEMKGPTTCFLAGTLISTPSGPRAIETLKPGMKVYSYNEKTGKKEVADFNKLDINFVDEYLIINNKINTTTYHPFYVSNNGLLSLVKAGKLKIGDFLVDESGNQVPVTSIQKVLQKETVYNLLTVTPNDNFFAEGILVHNYNNDMGDDKSNGVPDSSRDNTSAQTTPDTGSGDNNNNSVSIDQTIN